MKNLHHRLIPDLEKLSGMAMTTPIGAVRFSIKAKEILAPIFEANGFDIEKVTTVTQYNLIKDIVDNRISIDLAQVINEKAQQEIAENLDKSLDPSNPVDCVYKEIRNSEPKSTSTHKTPH